MAINRKKFVHDISQGTKEYISKIIAENPHAFSPDEVGVLYESIAEQVEVEQYEAEEAELDFEPTGAIPTPAPVSLGTAQPIAQPTYAGPGFTSKIISQQEVALRQKKQRFAKAYGVDYPALEQPVRPRKRPRKAPENKRLTVKNPYMSVEGAIKASYTPPRFYSNTFMHDEPPFKLPEKPKPITYTGPVGTEVESLRSMAAFHDANTTIEKAGVAFYLADPQYDELGRPYIPHGWNVLKSLDSVRRYDSKQKAWAGFFPSKSYFLEDGRYYKACFPSSSYKIYVEPI